MDISEEIIDYLYDNYAEQHLESSILCIAVYAGSCFESVECFISWWQMRNIALAGQSPLVLAKSKAGFEIVLQHLVELNRLSGS